LKKSKDLAKPLSKNLNLSRKNVQRKKSTEQRMDLLSKDFEQRLEKSKDFEPRLKKSKD
jgi:hypothetical protein